ncbi:Hypothetical predicted protein [Pelobates cultripes]|uniref:Uncharacterized protein n=1 Tax=Pelobates cultripes TaxID=61616 RepID=A0AAD1WCU6_PELCU|nr:Hypothetical predicted protein [Pelobates cultripes]
MLLRPAAHSMAYIPDSEVGSTCSDIQQGKRMDSQTQTATSVETNLIGPITRQLRNAGIDYRWSTPRSLTVTKDGSTLRLTSLSEAPTFLQALGLPYTPTTPAPTPSQHSWDPENPLFLGIKVEQRE